MRSHVVALLIVLAFCAVFQAWFLGLTPHGIKLGDSKLSDAYTEALAHGQSYLHFTPDPRLVAAMDPFGPATAALMISDTSYFRGHFYMYFGIVPFVTFLVPWRLATGTPPSPELTLFAFSMLGYAAYGSTLLLALRRWYRQNSALFTVMAVLTIIVAGGTWPLMGRPAVYEIENAAAYAFFGLSLLALTRYEWSQDRPPWAMATATACASLVMGCRPNYFPAITVVFLWAIYRGLLRKKAPIILRIVPILPIAVVGLGLAWWNFHRFGNVFDFGLRHTVSADPHQVRPLSTWANLPYHLHRYALGLPRLDRYFPFIQGQREGPFSLGVNQEGSNQVYGFLIVSPILLLCLLAISSKTSRPAVREVALICIAGFIGNLLFLGSLTMSCYRYPADFLGPLSLVAGLGFILVGSKQGTPRIALQSLGGAGLLWTVAVCLSQTFSIAQISELFDERRPNDFSAAGYIANKVVYEFDSLVGAKPKFLRLKLRLPLNKTGTDEPLLVVGERGAQDFIYVFYTNSNSIQIGFESMGRKGDISAPIKVDYKVTHEIDISLGSLLPPPESPVFRGLPRSDLDIDRTILFVTVDGKTALDVNSDFHPIRALLFIEKSPWDAAFGALFTGSTSLASLAPLPNPLISPSRWLPSNYGRVRIDFTTIPQPVGVAEPLLSIGTASKGEQLLLVHLRDQMAKLEWLTTDGRKLDGHAFHWQDNQLASAEVSAGSLFPARASSMWRGLTQRRVEEAKTQVRVTINGATRLEGVIESADEAPEMVRAGEDSLGFVPNVMPSVVVTDFQRDENWIQSRLATAKY